MVKRCFGNMDCYKTGNCAKCKDKDECYHETFDKLIEEGQIGIEGEIINHGCTQA